MMRKRFVYPVVLLLLVMFTSSSVSADCSSSWYNAGDADSLSDCGVSTSYRFLKVSSWYIQWYCDPNGYRVF